MFLARKLVAGVVIVSEFSAKSQTVGRLLPKCHCSTGFNAGQLRKGIQGTHVFPKKKLCSLVPHTLKKRGVKKKKFSVEGTEGNRIIAFSTAEEYKLELLTEALPRQTKYQPSVFNTEHQSLVDAVHAVHNPGSESGSQHIFIFREGSVVMWNLNDSETKHVLNFLKGFEEKSFKEDLVHNECEEMSYTYSDEVDRVGIVGDNVLFPKSLSLNLEMYAISNAMALSVRLGSFEANLDQYIETMEPVTDDLKAGNTISMTRDQVLQKTGQLFAFRHHINLNSDLLDTPDFYWDREELEVLYQSTFNYFCISKRTKVMNEKLNHCIELVELLSSHLNDKHHIRLEWMIIILIMVEVGFEFLHFLERPAPF